MKVTFTRTRERAYGVSVEGPKINTLEMSPAPGYHDRLPHDAAHFIVENELGITGGVFGQLAAGGTAGTFSPSDLKGPQKARRRAARRGSRIAKENKKDASFSERAIYAAQSRWEKHEILQYTDIPQTDIDRIISKFEEFAERWSKTPVGGSITLEWDPRKAGKHKR
jgi:hypothetical protein